MNVFMDTDGKRGPAVDLMFSCSHMTGNRFDCVIRLRSHYPVKNTLQILTVKMKDRFTFEL